MKQDNPPPSWSAIITAIEMFPDYRSLAQILRNKYLSTEVVYQGAEDLCTMASEGSIMSQYYAHGQAWADISVTDQGELNVKGS